MEVSSVKAPFLLGRLVFGGFFLYSGIHHFLDRKMLAQYAASKKVPAPDVAVMASGAMMIMGGASILSGVKPKLGTLAIMGFLGGVSPMIHDFWSHQDPNQRLADMVYFTKNLALLGGALALMGVEEPWPASLPMAQPSALERGLKFTRRRIAA
jgi:uncharacterized membrane protein YphA (DoxX/SURF4 family)